MGDTEMEEEDLIAKVDHTFEIHASSFEFQWATFFRNCGGDNMVKLEGECESESWKH